MRNRSSIASGSRGFTLLEILVASAVLALMMVVLLQMTNALSRNATRTNDALRADSEVRVVFDLMRRDLLQARIGTSRNTFLGGTDRIFFVSSTPALRPEFVSDQRQIIYFFQDNALYRVVVEPSLENYLSGSWRSMDEDWHAEGDLADFPIESMAEKLLEGVRPFRLEEGGVAPFFAYRARDSGELISMNTGQTTASDNPPGGVLVAFELILPSARNRETVVEADIRPYRYDLELNLPPVFEP